jgi:hypothetical protein
MRLDIEHGDHVGRDQRNAADPCRPVVLFKRLALHAITKLELITEPLP